MTNLIQQIDEMRIRMNELATDEQGKVRTLAAALSDADQRLLETVRSVAAEHEERRGAILKELQTLAARMCTMSEPKVPFAALEATALKELPPETEEVARGVDWRNTAASIQEQLAVHLKRRAGG